MAKSKKPAGPELPGERMPDPSPIGNRKRINPSFSSKTTARADAPEDMRSLFGLGNLMVLALMLIGFLKPDGLKGGLEKSLAEMLGFGDAEGMNKWRSAADGSFTRAVKSADMARVDLPRVQREYKNYAHLSPTGNPILDLIGKHESAGDYNRVYSRQGIKRADLTNMTIKEVLQWQKEYVANGSPSSAAGKYQIIPKTLRGLVKEMGLTGHEKFDAAMQDKMALHLMEGRGYSDFTAGRISNQQFMRNLSEEWASLPKDGSGLSFYHGDGLNRAGVSAKEVQTVLASALAPRPPVA